MKKSVLLSLAFISLALCLGLIILDAYISIVDYSGGVGKNWINVSVGNGIHMSVAKCFGKVSVLFFNQDFPYTGSIVGFSGDKSVTEKGYEGWGIYFRLLKDVRRSDSWWTLMISLWYPIFLFGILPAIFVIKKLCGRKSASTKETPVEK